MAIAIVITIVVSRRAPAAEWAAAGICLSVLAAPIAEEHQFVSLGIPMMLALQARARRVASGGAESWWPWIVFAILFVAPLESIARRFTNGWSVLVAYPRLYAAWLLWALTLREMLKGGRKAAAAAQTGTGDVTPVTHARYRGNPLDTTHM